MILSGAPETASGKKHLAIQTKAELDKLSASVQDSTDTSMFSMRKGRASAMN